jgi:hypothetical protein
MKFGFVVPFAIFLGMTTAGFTIGGRDGAIISIVGAAGLFVFSMWQAFKILGKQ